MLIYIYIYIYTHGALFNELSTWPFGAFGGRPNKQKREGKGSQSKAWALVA